MRYGRWTNLLPLLVGLFFSTVFAQGRAVTNFCAGKAAGTFYCIDETVFQHCTGNNGFALKSCPAKLCVTRTPADRNPCVGRVAATNEDKVAPPLVAAGVVVNANPPANPPAVVVIPPPPPPGGDGQNCVGGPKFDIAGVKNVGNGQGKQFIGGQCLNNKDCQSGCCAGPCGICSGPGAQFQAGKTGCAFGG